MDVITIMMVIFGTVVTIFVALVIITLAERTRSKKGKRGYQELTKFEDAPQRELYTESYPQSISFNVTGFVNEIREMAGKHFIGLEVDSIDNFIMGQPLIIRGENIVKEKISSGQSALENKAIKIETDDLDKLIAMRKAAKEKEEPEYETTVPKKQKYRDCTVCGERKYTRKEGDPYICYKCERKEVDSK